MKQEKKKENKILSNKNKKINNSEKIKITSYKEIGGPKGKEPTRYGDWEVKGITSDFWDNNLLLF